MDLEAIDNLVKEIIKLRQRSLLILYYSDEMGSISSDDIRDVYNELYKGTNGETVEEIDVIIHTNGGDPHASYRMIQAIRELSTNVNILVPFNAYSSGTLICLGANKILMGAYAALGPLDVTLVSQNAEYEGYEDESDDISLICIDKYVEFTKYCKNAIDKGLQYNTKIEEVLLLKFVEDIGAIKIAEYFRERDSTRLYAHTLLSQYMFSGMDDEELISNICDSLVYRFPSHGFEIDFSIAQKLGLLIEKMPRELSNQTKDLILKLHIASEANIICKNIDSHNKMPYIKYYGMGD